MAGVWNEGNQEDKLNPGEKGTVQKIDNIFNPRSVVFVGASGSPRKWGFITLSNLINAGFQGRVYPVNPKETEIQGLKVYRNIAELPEIPDLAVIVVPPPAVVPAVRECIGKGIQAGIVITAGFAELGERSGGIQQELTDEARAGGMVLVGPNCNGVMNPQDRVHIQFPPFLVPPGPIAIVSQSGNVVDSLARQIMLRGFGCSNCVSTGNEAVLHTEDYLEYLAEDPRTRVILCYVEGFKDGRRFFRVAGEVARKKPIVMLKVGKTAAGARAAMSHTASIAGSDRVFDAVCRQAGVIRAESLDDLLDIGLGFLQQPLPRGRRVGIVTAGGGWGVLAADASHELGFDVIPLPGDVLEELNGFLPAWWNRGNPVDLVAGSMGDPIFRCAEALLRSPLVDAALVMGIMTALAGKRIPASADEEGRARWEEELTHAVVEVMERFNALAEKYQKPVVVASEQMFADAVLETRIVHALGQRNSVCYHVPRRAVAVLDALTRYGEYVGRSGEA
jgi:acyl-CoA synthetase (NDP forming)